MEDELWPFIQRWGESGYLLPAWRHPEPGTNFAAIGPPRSALRVYYAEHAGQMVLLHVSKSKHGTGKLPARIKKLVEARRQQWVAWFPLGAKLNDEDRLVGKIILGGER